MAVSGGTLKQGANLVGEFVQDLDHDPVVKKLGESDQGHANRGAQQVLNGGEGIRVLEPSQNVESLEVKT